MGTTIVFTVFGTPQQRGSKRAFTRKRKDGSLGVAVADDNQNSRAWMEQVRSAASQKFCADLLDGPLELHCSFFFARPKSHYGSGKNQFNLRVSAPTEHVQRPDLDKLLRSISDSLTCVVWRDDSQVTKAGAQKQWTSGSSRADIIVRERGSEGKDASC